MNIFLIRHGETDKSKNSSDWQYPITDKGHRQAQASAAFLKDFFIKNNLDISKTTILHSPYIRTTETCKYFSNIFNLCPQKIFSAIEYQEGHNIETPKQFISFLENNPLLSKIYEAAQKEQDSENNESPEEMLLRAKQLLSYIKDSNSDNIIIITHNGFIRAFDIVFNNGSVVEYFKKQSIKNCSIRHYEIKENENINHGEILHSTKEYFQSKGEQLK